MAKITVNKQVFWSAGDRTMEGKVKQILSDHVVVHAEGSDYVVRKAVLSVKPIQRTASVTTIENGIVKTAAEAAIPRTLRTQITNFLWSLCSNKYYDSIPIKDMSDHLKGLGINLESDFVLTGRDGRTTLGLSMNGAALGSMIALQWHKMDQSGRYEINAYLT